ncbi:hypothetical protein MWU53_10895 [Aliiroseovarius sp. S1123]|jgi:hypothetical protein|nr:hypothetical protein [Aliiroseovarius sp. S1123]
MKQNISDNEARALLTGHHMMTQRDACAFAITRNILIHENECAVPPTPWTRQNSFKEELCMEGAMCIMNARLRIDENFDDLGSDPAATHVDYTQKMGAAGLAGLLRKAATLRSRMSPEISD